MRALLLLLLGAATVSVLCSAQRPDIPQCSGEVPPPSHTIASGVQSSRVAGADLDGDGDVDAAAGSFAGDNIVWAENLGDSGGGWAVHLVDSAIAEVTSLSAVDLDGDGDLDLLASSRGDSTVVYYTNTDGLASFSPSSVLDPAAVGVVWATAADVDGDGWIDVLAAADAPSSLYHVSVYRSVDGLGAFAPPAVAAVFSGSVVRVGAADFDADGDLDLYFNGDPVVYWARNNGSGSFSSVEQVGSLPSPSSVVDLAAGDINGDGWVDLAVAAGADGVSVFLNAPDALGSFVAHVAMPASPNVAWAVSLADIDNDGDLDLFLSVSDSDGIYGWVHWLENTGPPAGVFGPLHTIAGGPRPFRDTALADFDGDGDLDLVAAAGDLILYENTDVRGDVSTQHSVPIPAAGSSFVAAADLDGDGDMDMVASNAVDNIVSWFENTDGRGVLGTERVIGADLDAARGLAVADIDNDGDLDVAVAARDAQAVYWFANVGGRGALWLKHQVYVGATLFKVLDLAAADLDGDGDMDLACATELATINLAWFPNIDGAGSFGARIVVDASTGSSPSVVAADLDADGDLDLLAPTRTSDTLAWFANTDGLGNFSSAISISSTDDVRSALAADLDGDGDLDVAAVAYTPRTVEWFENTDGAAAFGPKQIVNASLAQGTWITAADLDGDGDLDLVASSFSWGVLWYENNLATAGSFAPGAMILSQDKTNTVAAADMDGDGDLDVLTASVSEAAMLWLENKLVSRSPFTSTPQPRSLALDTRLSSCASHGTVIPFACVAQNMARTSLCTRDTLLLPPGIYGCRSESPLRVTRAVGLASLDPAHPAVFDCSVPGSNIGGVLFHAVEHSSLVVDTAGDLLLRGVGVRGSGTARSGTDGTTALQATGAGAVLRLANVSVTGAASSASVNSNLEIAPGGAVLIRGGASLLASNTSFARCSSPDLGGAIAVRDTLSSAALHSVRFSDSSAGAGGGAVYIAPAAEATVTHCVFVGCAAAGAGAGGALLVHRGATVAVNSTSFGHNTAGAGGAVAVLDASLDADVANAANSVGLPVPDMTDALESPSLVLTDVTLSDNTASRAGGSVLLCGARAGVRSSLSFAGNVVASRSGSVAQDVLLCDQPDTSSLASLFPPSAVVHSPLASIAWVAEPPASVTPGSALSGSVAAADSLGNPLVEPNAQIQLSFPGPDASGVERTGVDFVPLASAATELPQVSLRLLDPPPTQDTALSFQVSILGDDAGRVPPLSGVSSLPLCGPGLGGRRSGAGYECIACSEGTYSLSNSFEPCEQTPACKENSIELVSSTSNTPSPLAQVGLRDCVCLAGFYAPSLPADPTVTPACAACPRGAVCEQGLGRPFPQRGFFPSTTSNGSFVACKRPSACLGGTGTLCAPGYEGYMCNTCSPGYYSNSNSDCVACPPAAVGAFVGVLFALLVLGGGVALLIAVGIGRSRMQTDNIRGRVLPASISMIVVVFQVIGILGNAKFAWSSASRDTLGIFNAANFDVNLFASECSLSTFHAKYVVSVLLPLVILAVVAAALVALKLFVLSSLADTSVRSLLDTTLFTVAPLLYIPMAKATFVLFDCTRLPNGDFVLDVDPGVACFDGSWWGVLPVGLLGLAGYVGGVPTYFLVCIVNRRHKLMTPATFARFGSLYKLYRVPYYWGGVAELGKRLAIVGTAVFVSDRQLVQIGLLLAIFLAAVIGVKSTAPYYYPLYNQLDFRLSLVLIVLLLLGGASYAERNTGGASDTVVLAGVVLVLVALAAVAIHAVAVDVLQIVQTRKAGYSAADDRSSRLAASLEKELGDMDPERAAAVQAAINTLSGHGPDSVALNDL